MGFCLSVTLKWGDVFFYKGRKQNKCRMPILQEISETNKSMASLSRGSQPGGDTFSDMIIQLSVYDCMHCPDRPTDAWSRLRSQ